MIVIDVGCKTYGGDASVPYLLDEFRPIFLYGFDPALDGDSETLNDFGSRVILSRMAVWTYDGEIGFKVAGLGGHVDPDARTRFPCIDLAHFIFANTENGNDVVLKMDAEGAEYTVLPHLVEQGADVQLKLALIEWHCEKCGLGGNGRHRKGCEVDKDWWLERRERVEGAMRCPVEEWNR